MGDQDALDKEMQRWHQHTEDLLQSSSDTRHPRCSVKLLARSPQPVAPRAQITLTTVSMFAEQHICTSNPSLRQGDMLQKYQSLLLPLGSKETPISCLGSPGTETWWAHSSTEQRNTNHPEWRWVASVVQESRLVWKGTVLEALPPAWC